jgi:hypothetical protein
MYILDSPNNAIYLAFFLNLQLYSLTRRRDGRKNVAANSHVIDKFLSNVKYVLCETYSHLQAIIFGARDMNITSPGAIKVFLIFRGFQKKYRHGKCKICQQKAD